MGSKPTSLPRFLPLESFSMRLPSSCSLLLASLTVSSTLSSLSALAAPVGDGSTVPHHAPIQYSNRHDMIGRPQTRYFVGAPELGKAIPGLIHAIMDALMGKGAPKTQEGPIDIVEHLVPADGKTTRAEEANGIGKHAASEDSSMQPFASQPGASTPPTAGRQEAPVDHLNPPAGCPSQPSPESGPVRRQEGQQGGGDPIGSTPQSPPQGSGSGGNVGAGRGGGG